MIDIMNGGPAENPFIKSFHNLFILLNGSSHQIREVFRNQVPG